MIDLLDAHHVDVVTVTAGDYDIEHPKRSGHGQDGWRHGPPGVEHKSTRLKAKAAELAANGKEHGGIRHYGYTRQRDALGNIVKGSPRVIVPGEAEVIRDLAAKLIEGASLFEPRARLKRSWGAGPRWPALALRGHPAGAHLSRSGRPPPAPRGDCRGGRVGADPGARVWEAVCRHLHDPARKQERPARAYLLTGLVVTTDGAKMVGRGHSSTRGCRARPPAGVTRGAP